MKLGISHKAISFQVLTWKFTKHILPRSTCPLFGLFLWMGHKPHWSMSHLVPLNDSSLKKINENWKKYYFLASNQWSVEETLPMMWWMATWSMAFLCLSFPLSLGRTWGTSTAREASIIFIDAPFSLGICFNFSTRCSVEVSLTVQGDFETRARAGGYGIF